METSFGGIQKKEKKLLFNVTFQDGSQQELQAHDKQGLLAALKTTSSLPVSKVKGIGTILALSFWEPYLWLIRNPDVLIECGISPKTLENRGWEPKEEDYGTFLLHASKAFDKDLFHKGYLQKNYWEHKFGPAGLDLYGMMPKHIDDYPRGALVGQANLTGVVTQSKDPWFVGPYGFVLKDAQAFSHPVYARGYQKFFEVDKNIVPEFSDAE